jgi:hypothetical protein
MQEAERRGDLPQRRQRQVTRVGRDAGFLAQAAPSGHLVLSRQPDRAGEAARVLATEHDKPPRVQRGDQLMASRPASVQVDGDIGRRAGPPYGLQFARGQQFVNRTGQRRHWRQRLGCREHEPMAGESPAHGPVCGHAGQEIAETKGAEDKDARWHD